MTESKNSTKILFTDLDGTLLNDQKQICPENRKAIDRALAAGHKIVITTGRPLVSAQKLSQELGLISEGCYSISFNGGIIYDCYKERVIFEQTLPHEDVRKLMNEAQKAGIHAQTYSDTCVIAEKPNEDFDRYASIIHIDKKIVPDVLKELGTKRPPKVLMIADHKRLEQFRLDTQSWREGKIDAIFSCANYLEFLPYGVSKGNALKILCNLLCLPLSASIAAGDEQNDISMIQTAHIGAVMKNASDQMKTYGNYITLHDNNHGAIAEIIERFMLSSSF